MLRICGREGEDTYETVIAHDVSTFEFGGFGKHNIVTAGEARSRFFGNDRQRWLF